MTYNEFKLRICDRMKQLLPENTSIQLQQIRKNNGLVMDGLTVHTDGYNLSPTFYLNHYYEQLDSYPDLESLCLDILKNYERHKPTEYIDLDFFSDYEKIRGHICYRLVNYEKNKELLQTVPHIEYQDLAIVFYCLLNVTGNGSATILIHNSHRQHWGISVTDLYKQAEITTPALLPEQLLTLSQALSSYIPGNLPFDSGDSQLNMHVLTNSEKLYGASCILYPDLLHKVADKLAYDLYLLPSSIHEVLLLGARECRHPKQLEEMIREINRTELSKEEVLSDHVYYYSRKDNRVHLVKNV